MTARIFLCYANEDKEQVDAIYDRLRDLGFEPWMDKRDLRPGEHWRQVILRVLRECDFVIVFLSQNSVSKRSFVQQEFKLTLEVMQEFPEGTIHTIPVRLDDCEVPDLFGEIHWANLFEPDGFDRWVETLHYSVEQRGPQPDKRDASQVVSAPPPPMAPVSTPVDHAPEPPFQVTTPVQPDIARPESPPPVELQPVGAASASVDQPSEAPLAEPISPVPPSNSPLPSGQGSDDRTVGTKRPWWSAVIIGAVLMGATLVIGPDKLLALLRSRPLPETITNSIGMEFVLIPAGTFTMGSPDSESSADDGEKPPHTVTISEPFYMGKYEVTQGQWKAVMGTTIEKQRDKARKGLPLIGVGSKHPMYYVSWAEVQVFIEQLNKQEKESSGVLCQLPTEAQWEYAARGGRQSLYSFGDEALKLGDYAWYRENSESQTHEVGTRKPNDFGLYDMHGNAWEWVQDWYDGTYYQKSPKVNPQGPDIGSARVIRGGSWASIARDSRSAARFWDRPYGRWAGLGFRCLSSAGEPVSK